ncbi:hypothetical protein ACHAWC_005577, partial [Mediolabrus comicus]
SSSAPPNNRCYTPLIGCKVIEAFTVGKELFLIFFTDTNSSSTETAMRLHFGMNGSFRTTRVARCSNNHDQLQQSTTATGAANWVIEAWDTTVNYPVSAVSAREKFTNLSSKDVCSVLFNAQDVFTSLRQHGITLNISDALLNQEICPGVGSVIKIESLHRAKIDPRRAVSNITDVELRSVIRHVRQYSMNWLQTGRAGVKLVYNQTICGTCKGMTVKMQKIGGGSSSATDESRKDKNGMMSRTTFWCTSCQPPVTTAAASSGSQGTILARNPTLSNRIQPQCPQHGLRTTKLSRVRKDGTNKLRIFFSCKIQGCQYFHWADTCFPNCSCGKHSRISKTEQSGGRWFLCCGGNGRNNNSGNGCGHFAWATADHLAPLSSCLTPLLIY